MANTNHRNLQYSPTLNGKWLGADEAVARMCSPTFRCSCWVRLRVIQHSLFSDLRTDARNEWKWITARRRRNIKPHGVCIWFAGTHAHARTQRAKPLDFSGFWFLHHSYGLCSRSFLRYTFNYLFYLFHATLNNHFDCRKCRIAPIILQTIHYSAYAVSFTTPRCFGTIEFLPDCALSLAALKLKSVFQIEHKTHEQSVFIGFHPAPYQLWIFNYIIFDTRTTTNASRL